MLALWRALVPPALVTIVYVVRTALKDRMLRAELDGYWDRAERVPYRRLTGVW